MKKLTLAIVIPALLATGASQAAEIYQDEANSVTVGGRINLMVESNKDNAEGDREANTKDNSSRINFGFTREMGNGWLAHAKLEWGMDNPQNDDWGLYNRLGYISMTNEQAGSISFGKQWSAYYDVSGATDVLWVYGGSASGTYENHGDTGTGRANDALIYRNNFAGLNLAVQYQFEDSSEKVGREAGYGAALSYDFGDSGFNIGAAYNTMQRTQAKKDELSLLGDGHTVGDAKAWITSAKYAKGPIYAAVSYGQYDDHAGRDNVGGKISGASTDGVVKDARGHEGVLAYTLDMGLQVYTGWNSLEDKNTDALQRYYSLGAMYDWNNVMFYTEAKFDDSKDYDGRDRNDNVYAAGVRYNF